MAKAYDSIAKWAAAAGEGTSGADPLKMLAQELEKFFSTGADCDGVLSVISGPGYKKATRNYVNKLDGLSKVNRENLDEARKRRR